MKKTLISFFVMFYVILVIVPITIAEPSSAVDYLMNEPVSMFDYGMQKLNDELQKQRDALKVANLSPGLNAYYKWDSNKIRISLLYIDEKSSHKEFSESRIKSDIKKVIMHLKKVIFCVNPNTGAPAGMLGGDMLFNRFFKHAGYKTTNEPKRLGYKLTQISELIVTFMKRDNRTITCKCEALSSMKDLYWSQTESPIKE